MTSVRNNSKKSMQRRAFLTITPGYKNLLSQCLLKNISNVGDGDLFLAHVEKSTKSQILHLIGYL